MCILAPSLTCGEQRWWRSRKWRHHWASVTFALTFWSVLARLARKLTCYLRRNFTWSKVFVHQRERQWDADGWSQVPNVTWSFFSTSLISPTPGINSSEVCGGSPDLWGALLVDPDVHWPRHTKVFMSVGFPARSNWNVSTETTEGIRNTRDTPVPRK